MKVRLKDIADVTGFSLMTVSLALNPRKSGSRISDETRKKIIQVAREMNYTPNMSARILSGGRSNVVGVMFNANVDGFYSELQLRIDKALGERGYTGLYTFWRGYDEFDRALEELGVKKMKSVGEKFDPELHDAVGYEASETVPEGCIIREWSGGFTLGEKLLRPARVLVSSGVPAAQTEDANEKE